MKTAMKNMWLAAACACALTAGLAAQGKPLFLPEGAKLTDVRQGQLGNCYFYASEAAMAYRRPEALQRMVANEAGGYKVTFADGHVERVNAQDVTWAEKMNYDTSTARWPAVLFRAFGQRVMRQALVASLERYAMFDSMKPMIEQAVNSSDELMLAYDRAVRAEVKQSGAFDAVQFRRHFKQETAARKLPGALTALIFKAIDDPAFGQTATKMIEENPELFGVNRAAGNGGQISSAMETLTGGAENVYNETREQASAALWKAVREARPAAAGTSGYYKEHGGKPPASYAWYSDAHAYTIVDFDGDMVTLRNPWATPPTDGFIKLPLDEFVRLFWGVQMTKQ